MDDDYGALISAGEVWVAENASEVFGVLVCQQVEGALLVRTVGISPDLQRKGLGTRLMSFVEEIAKSSGKELVRLYTNEVMTGNVELYARLGYRETHRMGPEGRQIVYMSKDLEHG